MDDEATSWTAQACQFALTSTALSLPSHIIEGIMPWMHG